METKEEPQMLIDQGSRVCSSRKEKALAEIELSHKSSSKSQLTAYMEKWQSE